MEESAPRRGRVTFGWLVGLSQVLGLVSVVLTGVWMGQYRGGFAWDGSAQQFNVHPLCMVLGLVFLQGDGESTVTLLHLCPILLCPSCGWCCGCEGMAEMLQTPSWTLIQTRLPARLH